MKKIIFSLTLLVVTISLSMAQDAQQVEKNQAEITFKDGLTYDFGTLKKGSDATYEFVFRNTGKEALVIQKAKGSCGCTVPTWPKKPIAKRKDGVIKVKYDSNRLGSFSKTITITSNAKNSRVVLTIKGKVIN